MSNNMFQQPSSGDMFKAADHLGKLLLIEVHEKTTVNTSMGESEVVRGDVTVLDAEGGPHVFSNTLIFGRALVGTLSAAVGGMPVLGRLGQGQAKTGQSAPWVLNPFNDTEAKVAAAYVEARAKSAFAQPSTPAPAAPAAPVDTADADALANLLASLGGSN
jgi:hypothetical protein